MKNESIQSKLQGSQEFNSNKTETQMGGHLIISYFQSRQALPVEI